MTEEHLLMCYPDQHSLASALSKRNIEAFRNALHSHQNAEMYDDETPMSVFEQACQTPNCGEFIKECIVAGCDVNKLNPKYEKRPINFVAESYSYDNLAALLTDANVNLDARYANLTPINFLASKIEDKNFDEIYPCIKLLVKHQANLNMPNKREMTPILHILRNKNLNFDHKQTIVTYLLENGDDIDIDSYRNGEARKLLSAQFADLKLPDVRNQNDTAWDFNRLMLCLNNEKEGDFLMGLNSIAEKDEDSLQQLFTASDDDNGTLLVVAIKKGLLKCVERMLRLGADVNFTVESKQRALTPIECACIYGHWRILELLLQMPRINLHTSESLVAITVKNMGEQSSNKCNYDRCFQLLLKRPDIDLDQQDIFNCSALHYAIKYNNKKAILALLKNGAYVGVKNHFNQYSISNINAKILEEHLDNCITTNDIRIGEDNFEIHFDYKNLVPVSTKQQNTLHDDSIICADEMAPVEYISKQKELRHLMKHPLITSFLFLKWHRLAFIFYMNLIVYCVFSVSIITYILSCYRDANASGAVKESLWCLSLLMTFIIFLRELFQLIFSPLNYLRSLENYLEIALLFMTSLVLLNFHVSENQRRTIAAITILLVAGELFILLGSLEIFSFSTHYIMLTTVSKSFIKGLMFYIIILGAFSLCFFALLNEPNENELKPKENGIQSDWLSPNPKDLDKKEDEEEEQEDFNKFGNVGLSLMKTVVMLTGEFDAASINFNKNAWSYLVFLAFLFLISTVLFNLLNGLAVSDTQEIKSEAELTNFIHRSNLMSRYEKILLGKDISWCCPFIIRWFARSRISIFKDLLSEYKIRVLPNTGNLVLINSKKSGDETKHLECTQFCSVLGGRCSRMPSKIIKLTQQLLDKKRIEQSEESEREELNKRISNIESSLAQISNQLTLLLTAKNK